MTTRTEIASFIKARLQLAVAAGDESSRLMYLEQAQCAARAISAPCDMLISDGPDAERKAVWDLVEEKLGVDIYTAANTALHNAVAASNESNRTTFLKQTAAWAFIGEAVLNALTNRFQ